MEFVSKRIEKYIILTLSTVFIATVILFLRLNKRFVNAQLKYQNTAIEMVFIPADEFIMGSPEQDSDSRKDEKPKHRVYLDAFYIDKYETTVAEFKKFVEESNYKPLGEWQDPSFKQADNHPVIQVSWWDALKYCNWRSRKEGLEQCYNEITGECDFTKDGYRLPTEAEWEKAARGPNGFKYPWGDEEPNVGGNYRANYSEKTKGYYFYTSPVDAYGLGKSIYGVYNMAGNVWEWCNDWYNENYYKDSPYKNPKGPRIGSHRVLRGGFWFSSVSELRSANRSHDNPTYTNEYSGFRCVRIKKSKHINKYISTIYIRYLKT